MPSHPLMLALESQIAKARVDLESMNNRTKKLPGTHNRKCSVFPRCAGQYPALHGVVEQRARIAHCQIGVDRYGTDHRPRDDADRTRFAEINACPVAGDGRRVDCGHRSRFPEAHFPFRERRPGTSGTSVGSSGLCVGSAQCRAGAPGQKGVGSVGGLKAGRRSHLRGSAGNPG